MNKSIWLMIAAAGTLLMGGCANPWRKVVNVEPTIHESIAADAPYKTPEINRTNVTENSHE